MPTETLRRGIMRWRAVVKIGGKIVASKWFGSGTKEGRKAILWERDKRAALLDQQTLPSVPLPLAWATSYLEDVQRRCCTKTMWEKRSAMQRLLAFIGQAGLAEITPGVALRLLQHENDTRSGHAANRVRKNLAAAWKWGRRYMEGFPAAGDNPFLAVDKFPEQRSPRYIPPQADFWRVLAVEPGRRLLLLAEMKVPGAATLDLRLVPKEGGTELLLLTSFQPRGIWGLLYWWAMWPAHGVLFPAMLRSIARAAGARVTAGPKALDKRPPA